MKHIHFEEIPSTNLYLKENYESLDNLTIVSCDHQTNGRGRLGRSWIDNDDLLFSILIKEKLDNPTNYSLLIANTLLKVLSKYNPLVKWPNDIIINDKKVAGILLEGVTKDKIECIIIGVGININSKIFPDNLVFKATSLSLISNSNINKNKLLGEIMDQFLEDYNNYNNDITDILSNIKNNFYLSNKEVNFVYNNKKLNGIVKDIDKDGKLVVETKTGILKLQSGEVTLQNIYK